jgi:WD40 repeat protein
VLAFVEDVPILADGSFGSIKFPPKHRVELGCKLTPNLIALGSVDKHIHIYQSQPHPHPHHTFLNSLQGHSDSLQSLATHTQDNRTWLASGSKDGVIRLWVIVEGRKESY